MFKSEGKIILSEGVGQSEEVSLAFKLTLREEERSGVTSSMQKRSRNTDIQSGLSQRDRSQQRTELAMLAH